MIHSRRSLKLLSQTLCIALGVQIGFGYQAMAADPVVPSGTMLLPMTPKLDEAKSAPKAPAPAPVETESSSSTDINYDWQDKAHPTVESVGIEKDVDEVAPAAKAPTPSLQADNQLDSEKPLSGITPEKGNFDENAPVDDKLLKATVEITADDTEFDQEKNTFLGTGNAVAVIGGQDSRLEADMILYDQNSQMIDARGNVKIIRQGQLTTGSSFKFDVTSEQYLITKPDTEIQGSSVVARRGVGSKNGMAFSGGTLKMDKPIYFSNARTVGASPIYGQEMREKQAHPEAYLPDKPSFKFKAKKMVFERYKEAGNLTIFGGRLMFGQFGVPLPKFSLTVGQNNSRVLFPYTPYVGNNLMIGGVNLGVMNNIPVGNNGKFAWGPMLQMGGRSLSGSTNSGSVGLGAQISYTSDRVTSHLGYGSVTNLVVADYKYTFNKHFKLQSGINRYIENGMGGMQRARLLAELVDVHSINNVPFFNGIQFRSSAGLAQDNPQLINQSPQYAALYGGTTSNTVMRAGARIQEQIQATTHPLFFVGNDKYFVKTYISTGASMRGYSTGNAMLIGQVGPVLDMRFNRVALRTGYTQSAVRGASPFVFDQFIQGNRSAYVGGDIKVNKYLTIGGNIGQNLNSNLSYNKMLTAAIGPPDFKLLLSRDMVRGMNRFGFDVLYGQPVPFDKLVLKASPDRGQLGGI